MTDQEQVDATAAKLQEFITELDLCTAQNIEMSFVYKFKDASGAQISGEAIITDLTLSQIKKKTILTVTPPAP